MNNFPKGNDLIVKWAIKYSDGTPFPLENYAWELCYSAGRGINVVKDTAVISVSDNLLTWRFSGKDQAFYGKYSLTLRLYQQGKIVATVRKNNAFELSTTQYDGPCDIDLVSYCDNISLQDSLLRGNKAMEVAQDADKKSTEALEKANTAISKVDGIEQATENAIAAASSANSAAAKAQTQADRAEQNNQTFDEKEAQRDAAMETISQEAEILNRVSADIDAVKANDAVQERTINGLEDQVNNYKPIEISGNVTNAADEEDITSENGLLKIKNRSSLNGMGYVILRKNKTFAEQVTQANTIYEIRYDFEVGGTSSNPIVLPDGVVLRFNGGKLINGYLKGNGSLIEANENDHIFGDGLSVIGTYNNNKCSVCWFGAKRTNIIDKVSCLSAINKAISSSFNRIYFPLGLWYVEDSINLLSKEIELYGNQQMSISSSSPRLYCATIFTDKNIDLLVVDEESSINRRAYISGGKFDVSLCENYTKSIIKFGFTNGAKYVGVTIKTHLIGKIDGSISDVPSSNGICFDARGINGGACYIRIDCGINGVGTGVKLSYFGENNGTWITDIIDNSTIFCPIAFATEDGLGSKSILNGSYQSTQLFYSKSNAVPLIQIINTEKISISGRIWDVGLGSSGAYSNQYAIDGYKSTLYLEQSSKDYFDEGLTKNIQEFECDGYQNPVNGRYNYGFSEFNNDIIDDGKIKVSYAGVGLYSLSGNTIINPSMANVTYARKNADLSLDQYSLDVTLEFFSDYENTTKATRTILLLGTDVITQKGPQFTSVEIFAYDASDTLLYKDKKSIRPSSLTTIKRIFFEGLQTANKKIHKIVFRYADVWCPDSTFTLPLIIKSIFGKNLYAETPKVPYFSSAGGEVVNPLTKNGKTFISGKDYAQKPDESTIANGAIINVGGKNYAKDVNGLNELQYKDQGASNQSLSSTLWRRIGQSVNGEKCCGLIYIASEYMSSPPASLLISYFMNNYGSNIKFSKLDGSYSAILKARILYKRADATAPMYIEVLANSDVERVNIGLTNGIGIVKLYDIFQTITEIPDGYTSVEIDL